MTEETIVIEIDDSQLDVALVKLDLIGNLAQKTTGKKNLAQGLPGINREMRLILGRIPGMRQALQAYFRVKRLQRGLDFGTLETFATSAATFQGAITIIATLIIAFELLRRRQEKNERDQKLLENFIRRERGVNQAGFEQLLVDWQKSFRGIA